MSDNEMPWRLAAMTYRSSLTRKHLPGSSPCVSGVKINMMARMIEPEQMNELEDWNNLVDELEAWGEVPNPTPIMITTEDAF